MTYDDIMEIESIVESLATRDVHSQELDRLKELLHPMIENEKHKKHKREKNLVTSYNNFIPLSETQRAITALNNSISFYEEAEKEIEIYQNETMDVLHALELTDLDDDEMHDLMEELRQARIYRRIAKNFKETVEPLYRYAMNNKQKIKELSKVYAEVEAITKNIKNRKYYPREKTALSEAFAEADQLTSRIEKFNLRQRGVRQA